MWFTVTNILFCFFRWLAKDEDDGQIIRELTLGGTSLLQSKPVYLYWIALAGDPVRIISHCVIVFIVATSYKVTVRTGDIRGAGTDANVYIHIFGKNGDTGRLPLRQSENTKNKFEKGRADMFTVEAVDIGKVSIGMMASYVPRCEQALCSIDQEFDVSIRRSFCGKLVA